MTDPVYIIARSYSEAAHIAKERDLPQPWRYIPAQAPSRILMGVHRLKVIFQEGVEIGPSLEAQIQVIRLAGKVEVL